MPLRIAAYSDGGLAVGYVIQDGDLFRVELLGADGFVRTGGEYISLMAAVRELIKAINGEL